MPRIDLGRPATYDDVLSAPETAVAEIVDGELWTSPRPAPGHANAHLALGARLRLAFDEGAAGPGGWRILSEPELHLDPQILVPDLAGWRREHLPRLPRTAFFAVAPDWICEVPSPSTAVLDRTKKLRIYAEHGVGHAWLVDPLAQTLEVLRLDEGRWFPVETFTADAVVRSEPFASFELRLAWLWDDAE